MIVHHKKSKNKSLGFNLGLSIEKANIKDINFTEAKMNNVKNPQKNKSTPINSTANDSKKAQKITLIQKSFRKLKNND